MAATQVTLAYIMKRIQVDGKFYEKSAISPACLRLLNLKPEERAGLFLAELRLVCSPV